ncbi:hypothetical protein GCM10022254_42170 [Actinomadura meridiana]|uniref:Uncharacterized protein n=1 Tax=Actinomadura meridiana TaxID=559626 RepID=A0ABP8C840_9ACTN
MTSPAINELLRVGADPVELTGPHVPGLLAALTRADRTETAITGAGAVAEPGPQVAALCAIADVLAGEGPARDLVRTALRRADAVPDAWSRAEALAVIAVTAAVGGDIGQALATAETIGVGERRVTALARISRRLSAANQPGHAHEIAESARRHCAQVGFPGRDVTALAETATALATAGDVNAGTDVAHDIGDPWARAEALTGIATPLARAGASEQAEEIAENAVVAAREVPYLAWRAEALAAAVHVFFLTGNLDVAVPLARTIEDPLWRAEALLRGAVRTNLLLAEEALTTADAIGHSWWNAAALADYAGALTVAGDIDAARKAAVRARFPESRARVLTRIARELPRHDDGRFEPLAAEALTCCRRMIDPVAAHRAAVELLTAWPGHPAAHLAPPHRTLSQTAPR